MYTLRLQHIFSAAHQLTNAYDKKCNDSIHGHNWRVIVEIATIDLLNGMVIDFTKVKEIINRLDHKNLNEILSFEPTAENLAKFIYDELVIELKNRLATIKVTIFEADKASITYSI
jgi:6-pyruvoyltetrahydropterin/6-carboxytetrahydropterin synthase